MSQMTNNLLRLLKETQEAAEQLGYDYGRLEREATQLAESRNTLRQELERVRQKHSDLYMAAVRLHTLYYTEFRNSLELPTEFRLALDALFAQLI